MNDAKHNIEVNLAAQIVSTEECMLTNPFMKAAQDIARMSAGFLPMESSRDPNAGENIISVNAAHAAITDNVDVARSNPISAMSAGAGENETKEADRTMKKHDDRKTARSLRDHAIDRADDGGGFDDGIIISSFFEVSTTSISPSLFVSIDGVTFLFCIVVDPPLSNNGVVALP